MEIEIRKLSDCPLHDGVEAFNSGFEGYFHEQRVTIDSFAKRFGLEDLSPEYSLLAYHDGKPSGIIISGIKEIGGEVVAWNGGTGVATELRGRGVGKKLMDALLEVYKENNVRFATLEALSKNEAAIQLYKKMGFSVKNSLKFLRYDGAFSENPFRSDSLYAVEIASPAMLTAIDFYLHKTPWQTHASNVRDGQAAVLRNEQNDILGYALFKKQYKEGKVAAISLFQLEVAQDRSDKMELIKTLLNQSFAPFDREVKRTTFNLRDDNKDLLDLLRESGFTEWEEQVWMIKDLAK